MSENEHHDGRLLKLEGHAIKTEGRLDSIERTQGEHGHKLDRVGGQLSDVLAGLASLRSVPRFDLHEWARTFGVVVTVSGAVAALAVWLIITLTRTDAATQALQLSHLREVMDLKFEYVHKVMAMQQPNGAAKADRETVK